MTREEENFEVACKFVIRLGTLAHRYGTQARRLESYLSKVTESLGYDGIFRSTPTEIQFGFKRTGDLWHKIHLVSMPGTGFDLTKLAKTGELFSDVLAGNVALPEATARLDEIDRMPPPFGKIVVAAGYALSGAGFAGFLRCGMMDIALSAVLGMLVYAIVSCTKSFPERFEHWVPFLSTFITGAIAAFINVMSPGIQVYLVTLSAVIYLIPGFTISSGVIELTYKYVLSGITNIVNGLIYLVLLFLGAWTGISMVGRFFSAPSAADSSIASNLIWPSAIIMAAGLCLVFQTPKRDFFWAIAGCAIACGGILLGESLSGVNLGNFLGTVSAVIFANLWSATTNRQASLVLLPSVVFLVSGSIGFRGFAAMSTGDTALGQQEFIQMFVVAASIAAGLIAGNSFSKPRITL